MATQPPPRSTWQAINPVRLLGELSETRFWMYLLLLPSALLITAIVLFPTVYGFQLSFQEMRLNRPDLGTGFVGLKHYARMVSDPIFWLSLRNTAIWVTASVAYQLTDQFTVSLEGRNLTDEFYRANMGRSDMLAGFETWGRTVLLGVTAKF